MNTRAILLWTNDLPWQEIKKKITILKNNGISNIYLVSTGKSDGFEGQDGVARIHSSDPISEGDAIRRAMHYILGLNFQEKYGVFLIDGHAFVDDRILNRVNQLTTISEVQPIDLFMVVRLTDKTLSKKYFTDFRGHITHSRIVIRGNEPMGTYFICNQALKLFFGYDGNNMPDIIDAMCQDGKNIFSITNGCC